MNTFYFLLFLAVAVRSAPIPSHSEEAELKAEEKSDQSETFAQVTYNCSVQFVIGTSIGFQTFYHYACYIR